MNNCFCAMLFQLHCFFTTTKHWFTQVQIRAACSLLIRMRSKTGSGWEYPSEARELGVLLLFVLTGIYCSFDIFAKMQLILIKFSLFLSQKKFGQQQNGKILTKNLFSLSRYIRKSGESQFGQGLCYTLNNNLENAEIWEPCLGRPVQR